MCATGVEIRRRAAGGEEKKARATNCDRPVAARRCARFNESKPFHSQSHLHNVRLDRLEREAKLYLFACDALAVFLVRRPRLRTQLIMLPFCCAVCRSHDQIHSRTAARHGAAAEPKREVPVRAAAGLAQCRRFPANADGGGQGDRPGGRSEPGGHPNRVRMLHRKSSQRRFLVSDSVPGTATSVMTIALVSGCT